MDVHGRARASMGVQHECVYKCARLSPSIVLASRAMMIKSTTSRPLQMVRVEIKSAVGPLSWDYCMFGLNACAWYEAWRGLAHRLVILC
jgi:hypothetical protein